VAVRTSGLCQPVLLEPRKHTAVEAPFPPERVNDVQALGSLKKVGLCHGQEVVAGLHPPWLEGWNHETYCVFACTPKMRDGHGLATVVGDPVDEHQGARRVRAAKLATEVTGEAKVRAPPSVANQL